MAVGQQLTQPEIGWRRYDNKSTLIKFDSSFYSYAHNSLYGGNAMVGGAGAEVRFNFYGTKLRVLSYAYPDRSNNHRIIIDGVEEVYSERIVSGFQRVVYEKLGLEKKVHTVRIICGTNGNATFDSFDIDADGELMRLDYFEFQKTLIQTDASYLYLDSNNQWQTISNNPPTIQDYLDYGMDLSSTLFNRVNGYSPIDELPNNFKLKIHTINPNVEVLLSSPTNPQTVYPKNSISLIGVERIEQLNINAVGNGKVAISNTYGSTWLTYRNGQWIEVSTPQNGMSFDEVNALTSEQLSELVSISSNISFSYYLTEDTVINSLQMYISMMGTERFANRNEYESSYDSQAGIIKYNILVDGTYTVTYTDTNK